MFFGVLPLYSWLDLLFWCDASVVGKVAQTCIGLKDLINRSACVWSGLFQQHFAHRPVLTDARVYVVILSDTIASDS